MLVCLGTRLSPTPLEATTTSRTPERANLTILMPNISYDLSRRSSSDDKGSAIVGVIIGIDER